MNGRGISQVIACAVAAAVAFGCGGDQAPDGGGGGSSTVVTGSERIGWDQPAADSTELAGLTYVVYVDGAGQPLSGVACQPASTADVFACSAPLPSLSRGPHTLEIAAVRAVNGSELESPKSSPPFALTFAGPATASAVVTSSAPAAAATTAATLDGVRLSVQTYASNLNRPVAVAFVPDGRLFVAESTEVRGAGGGAGNTQPALSIADALDPGEQGAFVDVAPHPAFAQNHLFYALVIARSVNRGPTLRLARFREVNGSMAERAVLLDRIPAGANSAATVRFGPDGRVYLGVDDLARSSAQDLGSYNGKILRLTDEGATPRDNLRGSPVFSYGHATPRGLAWHPVARELWETEQRMGGDALNHIEPNSNHQWPTSPGSAPAKPGIALGSMAPAGAIFYSGGLIPQFRNDLFFVSTAERALIRVRFDPKDNRTVVGTERLFEKRFGMLGNVTAGPDGALYVFTNNRGAGSDAQVDDDRVLRIAPASR